MTSITRSMSLLLARTSLAVLLLSFAVLAVWTVGDLLGQAPEQKKSRVEEEEEPAKPKTQPGKKKRVEEEEEAPRKKPKRKVIRVEDEEEPKAKPGKNRPAGPAASGDLAQLAEQANQPAIKALFRSLAIPYDLVLYKSTRVLVGGERRQREEKAQPISKYIGNDPGRFRNESLRFTPYTVTWEPDAKISVDLSRLESVTPYEKIAQDKVQQFLKESTPEGSDSATPLTSYDKLVAAGQALKAVVRWHESARQTGRREGKEWDEVEKALRGHLLEVLLKQMQALAQTGDWEQVLELARSLASSYTNPRERERIFQPVADMIRYALQDNPTITEAKKQEALRRLHDLEREFPDSAAFRPLAEFLQKQAQSELDAAKELAADKKYDQAQRRLLRAQELWPQLEGLAKLERELNLERPTLRIGVRGSLPQYLSPALACTENERRALNLLFESLVKRIPDEAGGYRYVRGLSESEPRVVTLGRQFELPRGASWSDGKRINSADIQFSLKQLQLGKGVGRSRIWGDLLETAESKKNLFQVTLQMRQGFLDTLAPMTFKILPRDQKLDVTSKEFAENPVTSGPFLLDRNRQSDAKGRGCRIFVANPYYRLRPSKRGAPHLQEVHFYTYNNAVDEMTKSNLDLVLDLTAEEAQKLAGGQFEVPLPSRKVPNRRIYFLALNTKKLEPYGKDLRQAISCAIDREALLTKHFRGPLKDVHKALTGPFPAGSWACKRNPANKGNPSLFDPNTAQLLKEQQPVRDAAKAGPFKLQYADDHPALEEALKDLCQRVKELTGVVLEPTRCSPQQLRENVEFSKGYEVAYYHYDFPDDSYWLGPLFSKPPEADDDQNIFQFHNDNLTRSLDGVKSFRNFAKVQEYQWETQEILNRELPLIPLWQLDPLLAYRRDVRPEALDPQQPFNNLEAWHLLRK